MITSISSETQKMEWTNGQSKLKSRCSVINTKKKKEKKLKENHETLKEWGSYVLKHDHLQTDGQNN